jgi:hypothetical protein
MPRSESLKKAQLKYYEKIKDTDEFKNKLAIYSKTYYNNKKQDEEWIAKRKEYLKEYYNIKKNKIESTTEQT